MEYRGKQYSVLQALQGGMWKWTIDLNGHTRSGSSPSRAAGINAAERAVDRLLAPKKRRPVPPGSKA
jgi:hypothetical protein